MGTAVRGRDMVIKVLIADNWVTVGGLRSKSFQLNDTDVDISDSASPGRWREMLQGAGIRSCDISGSGIFKDTAGENEIMKAMFNGYHPRCQFIVPNVMTIEGHFKCRISLSGDFSAEAQFQMQFMSDGEVAVSFA